MLMILMNLQAASKENASALGADELRVNTGKRLRACVMNARQIDSWKILGSCVCV